LKKCGEENKIEVSVSRGWYSWFAFRKDIEKNNETRGLKAMLFIIFEEFIHLRHMFKLNYRFTHKNLLCRQRHVVKS